MKNKGFTLIEILIALTVFAILASITSSVLYNAFNTRTRVNAQSERLSNLQMAISLIQQDSSQVVDRGIRGNDLRIFPIFLGRSEYMEFTRDGIANPDSIETRSSLKRVAYVCQNNALYRRTWDTLDPVDRNKHADKLLINKLSDCHFNFVNQNLQTFPDWRADAAEQGQSKESLPKAIQVNLRMRDMGDINLLFTIPETLYAKP